MSTKTLPETYLFTLNQSSWQNGTQYQNSTARSYKDVVNQRSTNPDTIPGYKQVIARRESATTKLDGTKKTPFPASTLAYRKVRNFLSGTTIEGMVYGDLLAAMTVPGVNPSHPSLFAADDQAKMNIVSQAVNAQQALEGLVALGELGQTVRMLANPLKSLRRGVDDYIGFLVKEKPRRMRLTPRRRKKFLADSYLEYSFGWKPLLNDIDDAAQALAGDREIAPESIRVTGFGESLRNYSDGAASRSAGEFSLYWRELVRDFRQVRFYGAVRSFSGSAAGYWPRRLGTTWTRFVPSLWELLPWSFVIDYFSNAGRILEAYSFHECNFAWVNRTVRTGQQMVAYDHQLSKVDSGTYYTISETLQPGQSRWDYVSVSREAYGGSFVPSFRFKLPGTDTKYLNLAALARSRSNTFL